MAVAYSSPALAPVVPSVARAIGVARRWGDPGTVALTFDDGPHPDGTPAVLEGLRRAGVTATFFLVGEQVERYPGAASEIVAEGHSVALHGFRHRLTLRLPARAFAEDLERGLVAIEDATGIRCTHYRPPYGIFSLQALRVVRDRGLEPLLWSRWGHDWRGRATAEGIAVEVTEGLRGGDVLLLHDADHYSATGSWRSTAEAVPMVAEAIAAAGLRASAV